MRIDRIEASKHKRGRVLVFLEDGSLLKVTEQELLTFGLRAGDTLDLGGGLSLDIVHPPERGRFSSNNGSLVARLTLRGHGLALLCGDAQKPALRRMLQSGADLRADVLVLPHHGSATSLSPDFYDAVSPRVALISCGAYNSFGFPRPEVLAALAERGAHDFFRPDVHRYLAEDGYILRLTPWLTWQPGLPPAAEARLLRRALPRCEAAAAEPVPREVLAALVNEEPWLPRVWDRLVTAEADPETALSLARRAALFDLSPAPWLRMRELARGLGRTDAWRQAQNALESYLLPREERLLRLRRLRPALRARCPELADEPNRVLALESAFQRDEYLSFERQVLYNKRP